MSNLEVHTDGASRGNPGAAAFAFIVRQNGTVIKEDYGCLGTLTNNQAEYIALVRALQYLSQSHAADDALICSDSELMVKQMNGEYRVKHEDLKPLYAEARSLVSKIKGQVRMIHVRREENKDADALCNQALDGEMD